MGKLSPDELALHSLEFVKMLEDSRWYIRQGACEALSKLPPKDLAKHSSELVKMLEDSNKDVCEGALEAVGRLCPADLAEHSTALLKMLHDSKWMLEDGKWYVRQEACKALGNLRPDDLAKYLSELLQMLVDESGDVLHDLLILLKALCKLPKCDLEEHFDLEVLDLVARRLPGELMIQWVPSFFELVGKLGPERWFGEFFDGNLYEQLWEDRWPVKCAEAFLGVVCLLSPAQLAKHECLILNDPSNNELLSSRQAAKLRMCFKVLGNLPPDELLQYASKLDPWLQSKNKGFRMATLEFVRKLPSNGFAECASAVVKAMTHSDKDIRRAAQEALNNLPSDDLAKS